MKRDLLSLKHLSRADVVGLVKRALEFKAGVPDARSILDGKVVGIYFRSTSTRTRLSFSSAALRLGASILLIGPGDLQRGTGETACDTGVVMAGFMDALVVRTASDDHEQRDLAEQPWMAVINAMSANEHPTQALVDLAAMEKHFGSLDGRRILYLGEGNNTAIALARAAEKLPGITVYFRTPTGYGLPAGVMREVLAAGARVEQRHDMDDLPLGVDVVYTTRWCTTGTVKPTSDWRERFQPFRVTDRLMTAVSKENGTVFMHDLPAVRGEEVDVSVIDGPQSIAFEQARWKLFVAMAVLEHVLVPKHIPEDE